MNYRMRFVTLYRRQGSRPSPWKRNAKKQNGCLVGLTNSYKKKRGKKQRRKGKIYPFECRVPRIARRDKKAFFRDQCKEIEGKNRMGKTRDLVKKIRDTKGTSDAKMSRIKVRNGIDLTEAEDIKKRWQEYTEELYKTDLHNPDAEAEAPVLWPPHAKS